MIKKKTYKYVFFASACAFSEQKANGECHTNFKRTKSREQVVEALLDFVESDTRVVVSWTLRDVQLLVGLCQTVRRVSVSAVGLSEAAQTAAAGDGGVRVLQNT